MRSKPSFIFTIILSFCSHITVAQTTYNKTLFSVLKKTTVYPTQIKTDLNPIITNLEAPLPEGNSAKAYLMRQKIASKEYYAAKHKSASVTKSVEKSNEGPTVGLTFEPRYFNSNGTPIPIYAGAPSDNTLAVSNDGIIMTAMNSVIYAHDITEDTAAFPNFYIYLRPFVGGSSSSSYYDPKLMYDPVSDRFILTLLKDYDPSNSEVIICFSSTNNPNDPWNVYHLSGNPLNNDRWTDFPCLSIVGDKLYYTANLIIPNEPWQIGFDGSIIWEMDKQLGYDGATDLNATLYSDIKYNGTYTRNLIPVQGAHGSADELFLLSNRNFAIENDTVFFLKLTDGQLDINVLKTDVSYGVPPNGRQADTDLSDPTGGLQTNDARVLGAIQFENEIQFVGNTINPETGFSAIYHGVISDINGTPSIHGTIIGDTVQDFAYPNIAWSGNESCDREVIIAFNCSSPTDFPGNASIHVANDRSYSSVKVIKEGYNIVDRFNNNDYERWGDYFGLQAKHNEPGKVYGFGFLPLSNKSNSGFGSELMSPDTSTFHISTTLNSPLVYCDNTLTLTPINGTFPYSYHWTGMIDPGSQNYIDNLCTGDSLFIQVQDSNGCTNSFNYTIPFTNVGDGVSIFPNPTSDVATTQFTLESDALIKAELFDDEGKLIEVLLEKNAKKGLNEFSFSLIPLASGMYTLVISSEGKVLQRYKVLKAL